MPVSLGEGNVVDSITRNTDEHGDVYYEICAQNNKHEGRIVRYYQGPRMTFHVLVNGEIVEARAEGYVHSCIRSCLEQLFAHFNMLPLDFRNEKAVESHEEMNHDFIIQAAKRAVEFGDGSASNRPTHHHSRGHTYGSSSFYREDTSTRLNLFRQLVSNTKEGYYPFSATTAYALSLLTFLAIEYKNLTKKEREQLHYLYECIAGKIPALEQASGSDSYRKTLSERGLKAEVNEITAFREILLTLPEHMQDRAQLGLTQDYTRDLVEGNHVGRSIVDSQTAIQGISINATIKRQIPSFFPIPPSASSTDQIVLQGGGCKTHSAIVSLWKQGISADGQVVTQGDGQVPVRYKVYRTVCNAGFGTTYDVRTSPPALYHEVTCEHQGLTYSVCTQEVLLPEGEAYSDLSMQNQVKALIEAERSMLLSCDLPSQATLAAQQRWRVINQSIRLGPVLREYSMLSRPQTTGNCTVRSIQEYLRWELLKHGASLEDANALLDRHWAFSRVNGSDEIALLLRGVIPHETMSPDSPLHEDPIMHCLTPDEINSFFSTPIIPAFPEYSPDTQDDLSTESLVQAIQNGTISCPKPTMMRLQDLFAVREQGSSPSVVGQALGYYLLQGCDSREVAGFSSMNRAVRQVASQFNNGEATNRAATLPNHFIYDRTQGPAEQRTSGGAAIARYAHQDACNCFGDILLDPEVKDEFDMCFDYRFGYLTPRPHQEEAALAFLRAHLHGLALNIERVKIDGKDQQSVIQVLNSGLALGGYDLYSHQRTPEGRVALQEMTELLLTEQYKAVAAVAILEAQHQPTERIPVSFTIVGGNSYGNDRLRIARALSQALQFISDSNVKNIDICLSIYSTNDIREYARLAAGDDLCAPLRPLFSLNPITQRELGSYASLGMSIQDRNPPVPEPKLVPKEEKRTDVPELTAVSLHEDLKAMLPLGKTIPLSRDTLKVRYSQLKSFIQNQLQLQQDSESQYSGLCIKANELLNHVDPDTNNALDDEELTLIFSLITGALVRPGTNGAPSAWTNERYQENLKCIADTAQQFQASSSHVLRNLGLALFVFGVVALTTVIAISPAAPLFGLFLAMAVLTSLTGVGVVARAHFGFFAGNRQSPVADSLSELHTLGRKLPE